MVHWSTLKLGSFYQHRPPRNCCFPCHQTPSARRRLGDTTVPPTNKKGGGGPGPYCLYLPSTSQKGKWVTRKALQGSNPPSKGQGCSTLKLGLVSIMILECRPSTLYTVPSGGLLGYDKTAKCIPSRQITWNLTGGAFKRTLVFQNPPCHSPC